MYIYNLLNGDDTGAESKTADKDVLLIQSVSKLCLSTLFFICFVYIGQQPKTMKLNRLLSKTI